LHKKDGGLSILASATKHTSYSTANLVINSEAEKIVKKAKLDPDDDDDNSAAATASAANPQEDNRFKK
jgi:hypothetical protein